MRVSPQISESSQCRSGTRCLLQVFWLRVRFRLFVTLFGVDVSMSHFRMKKIQKDLLTLGDTNC